MAFKYEKMNEDDLKFVQDFNFRNPLSHIRPLRLTHWTADRERKAFLIALGGEGYYGAEIPGFFVFIWKNRVMKIEAFTEGQGNFEKGIEVWWKINKIIIPDIFKKDQQIIMDLIREAFIAESRCYRIDCVKNITFDYIAEPSFVKEVNY